MAQPISVFKTRDTGASAPARDGTAVAATVYSEPWSCSKADGFSLHLEWTGTGTGNLQLWWSSKPDANRATDADWHQDATFGTAGNVALGGAAGKFGDNVGNAKGKLWRVKLASGASSGTLFGWATVPTL